MQNISRREFVGVSSLAAAGFAIGCKADASVSPIRDEPGGRLTIHPKVNTSLAPQGLQPLGLSNTSRDGKIFIPTAAASGSVPLLLLLHGAGGSSAEWFGSYADRAEAAGMALLAVDSRSATWDWILSGQFGPDVAFISSAIDSMFDRCPLDKDRLHVAGFSDGASYSLSIGLTNGDIFSHVAAFSAGLLRGVDAHGSPKVFLSQGRSDQVTSLSNGRFIAAQLQQAHYDVTPTEFEGGHEVPTFVSDYVFQHFLPDV
jgi:phospholipase/carboxylesterase